MWNVKYDTNEPIYETETKSGTERTDWWLPRWGCGAREEEWELGISRCKLVCIEWINSKGTIFNILWYIIMEKNMKNICINESLCCTAVINTILELNYTSIKKKKENITVRYNTSQPLGRLLSKNTNEANVGKDMELLEHLCPAGDIVKCCLCYGRQHNKKWKIRGLPWWFREFEAGDKGLIPDLGRSHVSWSN